MLPAVLHGPALKIPVQGLRQKRLHSCVTKEANSTVSTVYFRKRLGEQGAAQVQQGDTERGGCASVMENIQNM